MSMKIRIKGFFGAAREYVVAGATTNESKYGYKILDWYETHGLPVIPVNPIYPKIKDLETVGNVADILKAYKAERQITGYDLKDTDGFSISFVTPPAITLKSLKEFSSVEGYRDLIKGIWLQPGTYDADVLILAREMGLSDKVIYEGECILIRGDEGLYAANL